MMLRDRDPRHWKMLLFYYNPAEPRLWVTKRSGLGWTLNFARPSAWAILAGTVAVMASGIVVSSIRHVR